MLQFVLVAFLSVLFLGCGVDTASGPVTGTTTGTNSTTETNTSTETNTTVETNTSTETNTTVETNTSTETNTTVETNTSTETNTTVETNTSTVQIDGSVFDSIGAVLDTQACIATNGYGALYDSSLDSGVASDIVNFLEFSSLIPFGTNGEFAEGYDATMYRPTLSMPASQSYVFYTNADRYSITFDQTWISNANNTVYIKMPADATVTGSKQSCFRLQLNSTKSTEIKEVKVYRFEI